jgi:hypothetical protein
MKRLLRLFMVGDRFFCLAASQSFSLSRRETGTSAFLVVDHFPFAFSLSPAGFSSAFAALGAMLMASLSIRRSLVRPGLPANRTSQPIAARSVSEGEEE